MPASPAAISTTTPIATSRNEPDSSAQPTRMSRSLSRTQSGEDKLKPIPLSPDSNQPVLRAVPGQNGNGHITHRPDGRQHDEQRATTVLILASDPDISSQADRALQASMLGQLESGQNISMPVPAGCLIDKPLELYKQALNDPKVLAWFESKGLALDTVKVHEGSVSGRTSRDDPGSIETFTLCDTSGWWQVSKQVLAAREVLDLGDFGLPYVNEDQKLVPCNVMLDFYGVVPPTSEEEAGELANRLKREGWPEITDEERIALGKECHSVKELIREAKARETLIKELGEWVKDKPDKMNLSLSGQYSESAGDSPLAHKSLAILHHLNDFFELPEMIALCAGENIEASLLPVRISENKIQVFIHDSQWYDLTDLVNRQSTLTGPFNALLRMVKDTGNALYAPLNFDIPQILTFSGFSVPKTVGEVRNIIRWLQTSLPQATPLGDYGAELLASAHSPIQLTAAERAKVISVASGFLSSSSSIIDELGADLLQKTSVELRRNHADVLLKQILEKSQSAVCGRQLLGALNWYGAAETASPEHYQKLLLAAIKLEVDPDAPGKPGNIAGYNVYQAKNLGRDLTEVRSEIEQHLIDQKGVSSQAAPLIAHLFLADVAPEFLTQGANAGIQMGTATWVTLRLGGAIAECVDPGCSRMMTNEQLMSLSMLAPTTPELQFLFRSLAFDTLMTWAAMNGVVQQRGASSYSASDYMIAAEKFATQRAEYSQAVAGFERELVTRREIAAKELRRAFPNTPEMLLESTEGRPQPTQGKQVPIEEVMIGPRGIEEFNITYKGETKSIVDAYMEGDISSGAWEMRNVPMPNERFDAGWEKLPDLHKLLKTSVDSFFNARKQGFVTTTKNLIATLPLEDRQSLEFGEVQFFTLREETGMPKEDEEPKHRAAFLGRQGTLLRCEYQDGEAKKVSYFEVFPGRMSIIKRTDLPYELPLDGEMKHERTRTGRGRTVNTLAQRGTPLPFDFSAYARGSVPIAGTVSQKLIIEKLGETLPANPARVDSRQSVPDSYFSKRTLDIVDKIVNDNLLKGEWDSLFEKAHGTTTEEAKRADREKTYNFLLQLIPFYAAVKDLQSGERMRFINGVFGCFTDAISGLNTMAGGLSKGVPAVRSATSTTAKAVEAFKIAGKTMVSLVNPLDGVPGMIVGFSGLVTGGVARAVSGFPKLFKSGVFALTKDGIASMQACTDRLRAFFGGHASGAAAPFQPSRVNTVVNNVSGTVNGTEITAIRENGKWYALDRNGNPIGRALDNFMELTA
ncbi:hypothetical protein M5G20_05820 [Pseudomonas sp. TNT2022 ID1044]|uniref:hypothetical protein n=1 Tax=Pseudomonas sp. TNT2022 ID1044 TaxID=2942636 RepID=UPI002362A502|nr:hypothetical protein [Pseudomonas sp. TNT2022 ID1044]MDD0995383.1 hypothetical protein [Pseudomonas sp. TNT2022 ID1044]